MIEEKNENRKNSKACFECKYGCKIQFQRKCCLINHEKSHLINTRYEPEFQCQISECLKCFCSLDHLESHRILHEYNPPKSNPCMKSSSNTINSEKSCIIFNQELLNSNKEEAHLIRSKQLSKVSICEYPGCSKKISIFRNLYNDETIERFINKGSINAKNVENNS